MLSKWSTELLRMRGAFKSACAGRMPVTMGSIALGQPRRSSGYSRGSFRIGDKGVEFNKTDRGDSHGVDHAFANEFFAACETGKGWEACKAYCAPNATFAAQAEPLVGIKTLAEYTDWMKGLMTIMPDGSYEVKSFATDTERNNVAAYGVFSGTHTGPGGPCQPTGKKTTSDYVYVMQFTGDKISHMTKIWHSGMALKELGWA